MYTRQCTSQRLLRDCEGCEGPRSRLQGLSDPSSVCCLRLPCCIRLLLHVLRSLSDIVALTPRLCAAALRAVRRLPSACVALLCAVCACHVCVHCCWSCTVFTASRACLRCARMSMSTCAVHTCLPSPCFTPLLLSVLCVLPMHIM
jgi:hypothetical protein